ncbi:MAG TPA: hypothetical protein VGR07_14940 [Thermoanaerobaculia bacterium]|jgi:hypothetical protein|nr:hypothetical protein [Thermoanaerobaculia bacterium]
MADSKSGSQPTQKHVIIAGDDGTLYHLTPEQLQAHKMAPDHPMQAHAQKLVAENKHGVLGPEKFTAQEAQEAFCVSFTMLNSRAVTPEE